MVYKGGWLGVVDGILISVSEGDGILGEGVGLAFIWMGVGIVIGVCDVEGIVIGGCDVDGIVVRVLLIGGVMCVCRSAM